MKDNLILDKSFDFAILIIALYKELINNNEYVISKQLLRSATSIWANIEESLAGQSKKDFIHKMNIALKEARETRYWLNLLNKSQLIKIDFNKYLEEIESIINILTKIIKTTSSTLN